jgi:hypothetical protein
MTSAKAAGIAPELVVHIILSNETPRRAAGYPEARGAAILA